VDDEVALASAEQHAVQRCACDRQARDAFGEIGLGSAAATIWDIARWPLALLASARRL